MKMKKQFYCMRNTNGMHNNITNVLYVEACMNISDSDKGKDFITSLMKNGL